MVFLAPRLSLQLHAVDTDLKCDWLLSYTSSGSAAGKGLGSLFILISAALRDFFLIRVEGCILWKWRLGSKYTQTHNYFILCNWVGLIFPSPLFPAPAEWRWCLQTCSAKAVKKGSWYTIFVHMSTSKSQGWETMRMQLWRARSPLHRSRFCT